MSQARPIFRKPNFFERMLNKAFGVLVGISIGLRHNYLVEVPGRRTGRLYSTPIDLLELKGKRFLVAPRGRSVMLRVRAKSFSKEGACDRSSAFGSFQTRRNRRS
jgi:hypothetical protein